MVEGKKRGTKKINLSTLTPEEIIGGLLATPPPAEKQAKKVERKPVRAKSYKSGKQDGKR